MHCQARSTKKTIDWASTLRERECGQGGDQVSQVASRVLLVLDQQGWLSYQVYQRIVWMKERELFCEVEDDLVAN